MKNSNIKALTEGAIFAAITALIGIKTNYIPLIFFLSIFWAVPIIIIGLRNGLKISVISTIVASVLVSIFTDPAMGISFILVFGVPGITMGALLNRGLSPIKAVLLSGLVFALCNVAGILLGFLITGVNIGNGVNQMFAEIQGIYSNQMKQMMDIYAKNGIPKEQLDKIFPPAELIIAQMRMMVPSIFIIAGMGSAFISFKASRLILNRIGFPITDIKQFQFWRLPNNFLIGMLLIMLLAYLGAYFGIANAKVIILNIFTILITILTFIGLSVASFYLNKRNIPKLFKFLLLLIGLINFQYILATLGILDSAFNVRKLNTDDAGGIR